MLIVWNRIFIANYISKYKKHTSIAQLWIGRCNISCRCYVLKWYFGEPNELKSWIKLAKIFYRCQFWKVCLLTCHLQCSQCFISNNIITMLVTLNQDMISFPSCFWRTFTGKGVSSRKLTTFFNICSRNKKLVRIEARSEWPVIFTSFYD